ncbi:MAG: hypothetical protein M1828_002191 [Chrysothrix sp. TS-e1954]|nr:MAG: hypothetical protein M1828_002191 [Chrysothrix sp. TS-e1954]
MGLPSHPPRKRQRLLSASEAREESRGSHAASEQLLQKRFEGIFDKYGRDFDEVSDVVDMRSGSVLVDKGHLRQMRHERDVGRRSFFKQRTPATPQKQARTGTVAASDGSDDELSSPIREPASPSRQPSERIPTLDAASTSPDTSALAQALSTSIQQQPQANSVMANPAMSELFAELGKSFASAMAPILQQALIPQTTTDAKWTTPNVPEEAFLRNDLRFTRPAPLSRQYRSESPEMGDSPPVRVRPHKARRYKRRSLWDERPTPEHSPMPEPSHRPGRLHRVPSISVDQEEPVSESRLSYKSPYKGRTITRWSEGEDDLLVRLCSGVNGAGKLSKLRDIKDHFPSRSLSAMQGRFIYVTRPRLATLEGESTDTPQDEGPPPSLPTPPVSKRRHTQGPIDETHPRGKTKKRKRYERRSHPQTTTELQEMHDVLPASYHSIRPKTRLEGLAAPVAPMSSLQPPELRSPQERRSVSHTKTSAALQPTALNLGPVAQTASRKLTTESTASHIPQSTLSKVDSTKQGPSESRKKIGRPRKNKERDKAITASHLLPAGSAGSPIVQDDVQNEVQDELRDDLAKLGKSTSEVSASTKKKAKKQPAAVSAAQSSTSAPTYLASTGTVGHNNDASQPSPSSNTNGLSVPSLAKEKGKGRAVATSPPRLNPSKSMAATLSTLRQSGPLRQEDLDI